MPINTTKTGSAIAAHRQRLNLSQQGLADLMNVTHQAVSKWEKGLALPDTETLLALAKLFETSMEDLLMGAVLAAAEPPAPQETEAPAVPEASADETPSAPEIEPINLDFHVMMNMLPFVSTKVADRLFQTYANAAQPDIKTLVSIAPFVSTKALNEHLLAQPLSDYSPEMLCALAPFLPTSTVDTLIQGLNTPISASVMHALVPFASSKVVDTMVLGLLGVDGNEPKETVSAGDPEQKFSRTVQQKSKGRSGERESIRMRMARKAIEDGNEEWLCEYAEELDAADLRAILFLALDKGMYGVVEELIDEIDEDTQHALLDRALENNDQQLFEVLSENL